MNSKTLKLLAAGILIAFSFGLVSEVSAVGKSNFDKNSGKADIQTNQAEISVTGGGNVPYYHLQLNNSKSSYEVKFSGIQEFVDNNGDELFQNSESVQGSSLNFPSSGWDFSNFSNTTDSSGNIAKIDFNFTHTSNNGPNIQLRNHIDFSTGNQIKFDIVVDKYQWKSTNDSAKLVISMQITGGSLKNNTNNNDVTFGDAFLKSVSSAQTSGGDINVDTQVGSGNTLYLIYGHFNSGFVHDPTFGAVVGTSTNSSSVNTGVSLEWFPIISGLVVIGLVYTKKRKNN